MTEEIKIKEKVSLKKLFTYLYIECDNLCKLGKININHVTPLRQIHTSIIPSELEKIRNGDIKLPMDRNNYDNIIKKKKIDISKLNILDSLKFYEHVLTIAYSSGAGLNIERMSQILICRDKIFTELCSTKEND